MQSNVDGVFLQDQWTVTNRLTVNAGVRTEKENVPSYSIGAGVDAESDRVHWKDKIAPRLGFAYDVKGDGKTKVYGSWGIFYDIFKLNLPHGSFGGQKWISDYYTLDTPTFEEVDVERGLPAELPGHVHSERRLPAAVADAGNRRRAEGPAQADALAGAVVRLRTSAQSEDGGNRPLRPQAARSRDRRHRRP